MSELIVPTPFTESSISKPISRRKLLKIGGVLGLSLLTGNLGAIPANAEETRSQAFYEAEAGKLYSDGAGLRELFNKFNDAHERLTGENNLYVESPLNLWLRRFEATQDSSEGVCNGLANANVLKEKYFQDGYLGDVLFRRTEILGLVSALHAGDEYQKETFSLAGVRRQFNENERAEPIFLDAMVRHHLKERGEGICINFSPYPDQMWARMVDQSIHNYTNLGNNWVRVNLRLRTNGYVERGEDFHWFNVSYEINTKNIYEPGVPIGGDTVQAVWYPDPTRHKRDYHIRGNVFTGSMVKHLGILAGFSV